MLIFKEILVYFSNAIFRDQTNLIKETSMEYPIRKIEK